MKQAVIFQKKPIKMNMNKLYTQQYTLLEKELEINLCNKPTTFCSWIRSLFVPRTKPADEPDPEPVTLTSNQSKYLRYF
jgi:hypothetical protein